MRRGQVAAAALAAALTVQTAVTARADEGLWTFDAFPSAKVAAAYGFAPSQAWLDHLRKSSVRIAGGCSASFVSAKGLALTNHHCAVDCVAQLSTRRRDYVQMGFYAKDFADEVPCPDFELDRLDAIEDVTADFRAATAGKSGRPLIDARQAKEAELTAGCAKSEAIRCDVVALYHGGLYKLYHYTRFTDVRLVFAPEFGVAEFGGDPDNFNFPRYDYDVSFLRAYQAGKPAATPEHLRWSKSWSKPGDLTFVSGNPGPTQRLLTVSQLEYLRDIANPRTLPQIAELRGLLEQYQTEGAEQARETNETLTFVENDYKATFGEQQALQDPSFFARKVAEQEALRAAIAKRPDLQRTVGGDFARMAAVQHKKAQLSARFAYVAQGAQSNLFSWARMLVRLPVERAKPNEQRLPEYADARLVTLPQRLFAPIPIYSGAEELMLTFWAKKMREDLGADDPFVKRVLGSQSPAQFAHGLVAGTKLGDPGVRRSLYAGGAAAIAASPDPMIRLVARIDSDARAVRKRYEDEVTAPESRLQESLARARFAVFGAGTYPDGTFTPRLSYGTIAGFTDRNGQTVAPYTTLGGLFDRATGSEPYALPASWLSAKPSLDLQTPLNLCSTNDVVGGNSGSPMVDKRGELIGLIFDGNIFSLGGAFGYQASVNRTVAVDGRMILAGLQRVYHADRLLREMETGAVRHDGQGPPS